MSERTLSYDPNVNRTIALVTKTKHSIGACFANTRVKQTLYIFNHDQLRHTPLSQSLTYMVKK